ncbi:MULTISPECIES: hypothetical protein [Pseudomonas]|uniref:Uncharacterized protein n=1 Tax=Pseudomonas izuensis TaxID=2684212 RepID=A0ABM7RL58_9PSED|nr:MULTISPECIES: hypothetical protein [Pseudomonas]RKS17781.1 hypothetical protein BJ917_4962 [Pseudomonas sp. WPR_5_2]BCX66283.1 hypothetical protein LAB08_R08980 [Pseudomonas izuensis]
MTRIILPALAIFIATQLPAYAINDKYRKQLEQSCLVRLHIPELVPS